MNNKIKFLIKFLVFNLFGDKIFAKLRTIYWIRRLRRNKFYEKEISLLPVFTSPGDTVIDIGANFGQYTYTLSKIVGSTGKVFAFEPVEYTFEILKEIIKKLKLTNVELRKIAIGDKNGEIEFITPKDSFGGIDTGKSHLCGLKEKSNRKEKRLRLLL